MKNDSVLPSPPPPITEILIIGGGLAGLFCALKLAPLPVTILTADSLGCGTASGWAQGGIAAALSEGDSPEQHTQDTFEAGAGLVAKNIVLNMAREAAERVGELLAYGVPFDQDLEGRLIQSQEAAHSRRRIVRVHGDRAGPAIMAALIAQVRKTPELNCLEHRTAESFVYAGERIIGVHARYRPQPEAESSGHLREEKLEVFLAQRIILATGGIGQLFAATTNPIQAQGVGIALAGQAGAKIANAEFVQFHPTAMNIDQDPAPLATEALRGEGAKIFNEEGVRFLTNIHPAAELAPRDIVARAVFQESIQGRVYLDARQSVGKAFPELFPTVYASCKSAGIDPVLSAIPIMVAEHYHMGGVWTDERGRTSLPHLWAIGEVACTGVHGANRLASNSLLEAVVFGARVAQDIQQEIEKYTPEKRKKEARAFSALARFSPSMGYQKGETPGRVSYDLQKDQVQVKTLRHLMMSHVGVCREEKGLREMLSYLMRPELPAVSPRVANMRITALMITLAAYQRRESRGSHYRTDYPNSDPTYAHPSLLTWKEVQEQAKNICAEER